MLRELPDATVLDVPSYVETALYDLIWGSGHYGVYTWSAQELSKGRTYSGEVLGSRWGGWGFNIQRSFPTGIWTSTHADTYTDEELMLNPYWRRGGEDVNNFLAPSWARKPEPHASLFQEGEAGSNYAKNNLNTLLAEGFPCRTLPAGANPIGIFDLVGTNHNMMNMKNQWWSDNVEDGDWLHGDIKDVSYTFTWKVFDEFVNIGDLNN